MNEQTEKTRQEREDQAQMNFSTVLDCVWVSEKCLLYPAIVNYHPPSHSLHEYSQRMENSDIDESPSPSLTFLMRFLNKWDFSISRFIASIKGSLNSLCHWMEGLQFMQYKRALGGSLRLWVEFPLGLAEL